MTDNKKYIINVGEQAEEWTSDMYAQKGDSLFAKYKDAEVFEVEDAADFDEDPTDHQYIINVGDESEVWDGDMVKEKGAKLKEAYPDVKIQRVSYKDYWGEQATANREQRALLAQPDQERNARLAELGYYDDISGEAFTNTQSEDGVPQFGPSLGLQPLSSVMSVSSVTGLTTYGDPAVQEFFANDTYADRQAEIARLDAEYESNPSVIAQREYEAQWRADQAKYNDTLEAQIRKDAEADGMGDAQRRQNRKMAPMLGMGNPMLVAQYNAMYADAELPTKQSENYASALNIMEKIKELQKVSEKGFGGATLDVAKEKFESWREPDIALYNRVGDILTNLEAEFKDEGLTPENLTPEVLEQHLSNDEKALILAFFQYNSALEDAQQDMSAWYKGGKIFAESVPFMLEFLATGGLYKAAGSAATKGMAGALKKWVLGAAKGSVKRTLRKGAAVALRDLVYAGVGTLARTVVSPGTYNRMAEESVKIEDGHLDRTKNVFKSFADSYIENLSEISGGLIGEGLGIVGKGIQKGASLTGISFSKLGGMLADNRLMQVVSAGWKSVAPKLEALGFHGIFEEIGEEYIGNAIRELTIQPGALAEMHKDGNFGAMLIGFAPMTLFGGAVSAVTIGARNIEAANLGSKLRETLGVHYSEEQVEHMMNLVSGAENAEEIWEAVKPLTAGLNAEETQQLLQYGAFMAQNKAMLFARQAQEDNLAQAKRAQLQQTYNKFWQENAEGVESVQLASLNDGRTVFVVSEPTADGVVSIIDASTGAKGFTNISNYKTEEVDGAVVPMTQTWSMDAYLEGEIASERRTAEGARMEREYNEQVKNLQSQIKEGTRINLGTEGNPVIMLATGQFSKEGVTAVDQAGNTHTIGWNQVADAMQQPIGVKTDQQIIDEEIAAVVARNADRRKRMSDATPAMTEAVDESAVQTSEAVALESRHIPMNEDGTVNEAAFWEQDPEGYVQWNDEQNQDGGADSLQQIGITKAVLSSLLAEAQKAQQTSNPAERKAAKQRAQEIAEKIDRLTAIEASYAEQRLAPLRERAMRWKGLTNAPVHIVETEEDLASISGQAAESSRGGMRVRGFAKDGRAYIYLPGIVEESEIDAVFMHEAVAHTGLKGMLGQQAFDQLCDQVWEMMSPEMQNAFINYPGVNGNTRAAADEYIAHIAETMGAGVATEEEKTIWQQIIDFVRNILRSMGITLNVSESELSDLIHMAYADLAKNMAEAEEIASQQKEARAMEQNAPSAARQEYNTYAEDLTHDEIKAVAENDFTAAQQAYDALVDSAPRVEAGESAKDFIARKKAYNEQVAEAKAALDARQALMDEIARIDAENAPVLTDAEVLEQEGLGVDTQNDDVRMSVRYVPTEKQREMIIGSIMNVTGRTREEAERWLASETSLAAMINEDLQYLDYVADPKYKAIKDNSDYPQGTVDFNNICRKRLPFTRMFTRLQRRFPNRVFTAEELADIRTIMSKDDLMVACGLCYVEDRRQMVGEVAQSFIDGLQEQFKTYANNPTKKKNAKKFNELIAGDTYVPQVYDLTTQEGLDKLYNEHRGIWEAFQAFNNARGQQSQNLLQGYAEYKREILSWSDKKVKSVNDNGGLRIFSYSDFEAHHLIDVVQIIIDCAAKGVKIQGYTKVPEFARAVANTGIKLNRSLIPLGDTGLVDGQLAFDSVEGIDINDPNFLESNDNVGNILIGINDEQIRIAMADPRIHYIIPYHARQKENIRQKLNVGAWTNYISTQNERNISDGKRVKDNINIYTDILTGDVTTDRQFVEKYLQLCKEKGRIPKFDQFLERDAEGNYLYTPGYYKFLVDFKLFDENGNILPQQPVVAEFDNAFNMQILEEYAKGEKESTGDQMNETYEKIVEKLNLDETTAAGEDVRFSTVQEVNDRFNAELQQQIEGTLPAGHVYQLGMPSAILVSAGIPSLPIEMASKRLLDKSNQRNHPFELSEVMGLPRAIQQPLAVFRSATHIGSNVILTELKQGSKNFVVAIETNRQQGKILVNSVRSLHPRTTQNIVGWINEGLMDYANKDNLLAWIDDKIKTRDYLNSSNPADVRKSLASAANIVKEFVNPSITAENEDTHLSVRTDERREQLFDAAKKEFGTTDNFKVAGYMLPDGSLLDFSEEGAPANQRTLDHREIEGIIMDEGKEYEHRWQYLADFMNEGAIRLLPEYAGINLMHAPTAEQRKKLFDFIYKYNGEVILEIADERLNNVAYVEYDRRTSPSRIFRDIDGYFNEGIVPQQDVRFSVAFNSANEELNNTGLSMDNTVLMQEYGLSAIELSKKGNYVILSKIVAAEQGQGNGTRFMEDLTKNADANGWILALTPDTTYGGTSVARLKKFYKRFGFKDNKGRNTDFNTKESMVRTPIRFSAVQIDPAVRQEMDTIKAKAMWDGTFMKAPNGAETKLTEDQWLMVRTKNFINWFGDWINDPENASKVVDENGEPKVVYHQTNSTVYINRETGQNWDELDWKEKMEWDERDDWEDYWEEQDFNTFSRVNARTTNEFDGFFFAPEYDEYHEYGDRAISAFLNIKNPASNKDYNIDSSKNNAGRDERIRLQEAGFDGVIRMEGEDVWEYVAFEPNQIKSATETTGEFSESGDIRYSANFANPMDSQGNTLSPEQREFFANSKAVDKEGNLLALYHGTPRAGFTEFKSGWFTTSKEDAISYSGDRKGRMFDPNEEYVPETLTAGDFRLGYMTFDSEEDRTAFLERFPAAETAMSERDFEIARMGAEDKEYDALTARRDELKQIWDAYREYERDHFVDTTVGEILESPNAYTEDDLRRALLAYDSNVVFDSIDEIEDAQERKDVLISALNNANEETEGRILDLNVETRVPRNGEGIKHNDLGRRTYEVYANLENPYEIDAAGRHSEFESGDIYEAVEKVMSDEQYDGVIIRNWRVGRHQQLGDVVVPKRGDQIKLTSNIAPSESEDIRYSSRFDVNTNPTEAQKKAGNYKMGHLRLDGYNITIENPKGSVRRGIDSKGNEWENTLNNDYGYIRGTEGVDGDHIDVYLSDNPEEGNVFVVDQVRPDTGEFDEHKVMYGFGSIDEAREAYLANFSEGWNGLGTITEVTKDEFRKWIDSSHRKTKPFSEYKSVKTDILDEGDIRYSVITDPALLERLDSEPTIKMYRAMQLIDGKLYPPMSAKVDGKMREPIELGKWEQAEERPDLADEKGYFKLDKGNKTSLKARYNPYFHTSPTPLNDQFSSAQTRPELVTVEVEVSESELTSGYKAEKAKDSVGQMEWKAGAVQSKLSGTRTVILSRWDKPIRIVPDSEVADKIVEMFDGKDITMPSNVVTPSLRAELESRGIPFVETDNNGKPVEADTRYSVLSTPTDEVVAEGMKFSIQEFARLAGNIFEALPEAARKEAIEETFKRGWDMQSAIFQIPARLAEKESWDESDKKLAQIIREKVQDALEENGGVMSRPLTSKEALWMLYRSTEAKSDSMLDMAKRSLVARNLGFGVATRKQEKEDIRFSAHGDRSVDDLVETGRQKAQDAKSDFMDTILAINGKLDDLRKAASAQRKYDEQTVKIIASLANELLEKGALSDLTRGEVKRLISVLKDSVGKRDLTVSFDRLMDILIANQLRFSRERFEQLLKIKASKVDARGVEVKGKLDVSGQKVVRALKDGIGLDVDTLTDRISDCEDKLTSESEAVRANAEVDLMGYKLALNYMIEIKASQIEEKNLRKSLEDAKEDYDAGYMTKDAYREFKKSAYNAIRENRMERVKAYDKFLSKLTGIVKSSIIRADKMMEAEKQRVERIHHFANSDMQGMPAAEHERKESIFWNNPVTRFLLKPFATFDQMLRSFAPKSRNGEGYLWNHFMGGWLKATENEYKGIQAAHEILDAKAREVFGPSVKRWSDIFILERSMRKAEVTLWDDGDFRTYELPQGNLLYIYMVNKMSDGKMKLRRMGITETDVFDVMRALDPRFIEIADWIQDEFLPSLREKYNAVHERLFGAPMAAIDNYFPLKVNANSRTREIDLGIGDMEGKPSTITGSIIKRTKNALALDLLHSDAFDVVLGHIEEMEHWAAFAEWNQDLNSLLSYRKFRNRVQNTSGIYGTGTTAWNSFKATAEIAAGVYKPATKADSLDKHIMNIAKGVTGSKIAFRVYTAFKQLLSWPAFLADANWAILAKNFATPAKAWNWCMENLPLFEKRWKSRQAGDSRLMETDADWKIWKNRVVEIAGRLGMTPNAFIDALTVAIGSRSVYETKVREYLKYGYSQEEADEKAKRDATVSFNESQQSNESAFLSQVQIDRTVASVVFTVFRNSSMGYQRQYVDAIRNIVHMMKPGYKESSIEYMRKQMIRDGLADEQADRAANKIFNRSFTRNALKALTFGFVVQFAWNLGPSLVYMLLGDDDEEKRNAAKDAAVRALIGGPIEGMASGNVISNILGNVAMGEELSTISGAQLPAVSDLENIVTLWENDKVRATNEVFNLFVSSGLGFSPQTMTDAVTAIIDATNGDLGLSTEITLALLRILQVPQSQTEKLYMDEIDMKADDAFDLTVEEFAERYARYKLRKSAGPFASFYSDEKEKERINKLIKQFTSKAEEARRTRGSEVAKEFFEYYDNEYEETRKTISEMRKEIEHFSINGHIEEAEQTMARIEGFMQSEEFEKYAELAPYIKMYEGYKDLLKKVDNPETKMEYAQEMTKVMNEMVKIMEGLE